MDVLLKNVKKKDFPVFKSLAKSLGFEIEEKADKPYNPEFVKQILEAREELKQGNGVRISMEELDSLLK